MPHIGVHRLGAGHREEHRAQHDEAAPRRVRDDVKPVERVEREEDARLLHDPPQAEQRQDREPDQHHRAEQAPTAAVPRRCTRNKPTRRTSEIGMT